MTSATTSPTTPASTRCSARSSDFDALVAAARERGLDVLMDLVPCHTSIEHPWFREHPDWYIWADAPNNWRSAFGGSAWSALNGRYYLHSFYPEQPDLDWRNPEVVAAMQDVVRFWLERGAAGYRVDAIDRLLKDPQLRDDPPATEPFGLPLREDEAQLALTHSRNAPTPARRWRGSARPRATPSWWARCTCPPRWRPTSTPSTRCSPSSCCTPPGTPSELRARSRPPPAGRAPAWVMSNHDFGRLATRFGRENARAAALLLLTLPGTAFLYQGDEIGQADGPGGEREFDRAGRDRFRHPMQWDGRPEGGLHERRALAAAGRSPERHNVEAERDDPDSMLTLVRELINAARELAGTRAARRRSGGVPPRRATVAINTTPEPCPAPGDGAYWRRERLSADGRWRPRALRIA